MFAETLTYIRSIRRDVARAEEKEGKKPCNSLNNKAIHVHPTPQHAVSQRVIRVGQVVILWWRATRYGHKQLSHDE